MTHSNSAIPTSQDDRKQKLLRLTAIASVTTAVILSVIKVIAWFATGSVALLGSLLDSLLDCVASLVNFYFLHSALQPVDREHRFGHGKAEPLGGIIQAILIGGSALFLLAEATRRIIEPALPGHTQWGIAVMVISCIIVGLLVTLQRYTIRRTGSLIIAGDALHGFGDVTINLGVIAALFLSDYYNAPLIDPAVAIVLVVILLRGAWTIARRAINELMDTEFSEQERSRIRELALSHPRVFDIHDLRTRRAGFTAFIQLHIEMDGDISLTTAHATADEVEAIIQEAFPDAEVFIHQDPKGAETINPFLRS